MTSACSLCTCHGNSVPRNMFRSGLVTSVMSVAFTWSTLSDVISYCTLPSGRYCRVCVLVAYQSIFSSIWVAGRSRNRSGLMFQ
ncbi:hypothetical protein D3C78_1689440 [compost metagenome]